MTEVEAYSDSDSSGASESSSGWKVALLVLVLLGAAGFGAYHMLSSGEARATKVWFYDLSSGKLFTAIEQVPPIAAPSGMFEGGPGGVLAVVYSCGDCADEGARFVAWLARAKAEDRATIEKTVVPAGVAKGVGVRMDYLQSTFPEFWQVRATDKGEWLAADSAQATKLRQKALQHCGAGSTLTACPGPEAGR